MIGVSMKHVLLSIVAVISFQLSAIPAPQEEPKIFEKKQKSKQTLVATGYCQSVIGCLWQAFGERYIMPYIKKAAKHVYDKYIKDEKKLEKETGLRGCDLRIHLKRLEGRKCLLSADRKSRPYCLKKAIPHWDNADEGYRKQQFLNKGCYQRILDMAIYQQNKTTGLQEEIVLQQKTKAIREKMKGSLISCYSKHTDEEKRDNCMMRMATSVKNQCVGQARLMKKDFHALGDFICEENRRKFLKNVN